MRVVFLRGACIFDPPPPPVVCARVGVGVRVRMCAGMRAQVYMRVCMCVQACMQAGEQVRMWVCVCVRAYACRVCGCMCGRACVPVCVVGVVVGVRALRQVF